MVHQIKQVDLAQVNRIAELQQLQSYKAEHGHCNVYVKTGTLGRWIHNQQRQYYLLKDGKTPHKTSHVTDERVQKKV